MPEPAPLLSTRQAFQALEGVLRSRPAVLFEMVGGEVGFVVQGAKRPDWTVRLVSGEIRIVEGAPPKPVVTIALDRLALTDMVRGCLDVEMAFKERHLAVSGDLEALKRFVACFNVPEKVGAARSM